METQKNSFIFDVFPSNILFVGEEVDDFHTLDKSRLFALNFSATQQLDKNQRSQKEKIEKLEKKVNDLTSELMEIKQLLLNKKYN